MTGVFVAVVGPSGSGKDTLIAAAREALGHDPRFAFVRRTVTRAGGGNEDHDTVDPVAFAARRRGGAYVLTWGAHGLYYAIPSGALHDVRSGRIAVANLSRGALTDARAVFPSLAVVCVTAPPEVLAARLAGRGREGGEEILSRLRRSAPAVLPGPEVAIVDNSGALEPAVARFCALLRAVADAASPAPS